MLDETLSGGCVLTSGKDRLHIRGTRESPNHRVHVSMDGMGFFLRGRYELEDRMSLTLAVYWDRSMMTVALPLSAVRIWMELSHRSRRAESPSLERLGLAGFGLRNTSHIFIRMLSATVLSRRRNVGSTDWMISSVRMDLGVRAKFIPKDSTDVSGAVMLRWLRLTIMCLRNASWERRRVGCREDKDDPAGRLEARLE